MSLCPAAVRLLTDARHLRRSCSSWPACGGANGSIRFEPELAHGANAGLKKGVNFLKEFKEQFPLLSWADIIQLASAIAIECCGGPTLPMRYGRLDVSAPEQCPKEGNLPDANMEMRRRFEANCRRAQDEICKAVEELDGAKFQQAHGR